MTKNAKNCLFCDSARHNSMNCTSTKKGQLPQLYKCMENIECPQFATFTLQELKFIAFTVPYQHTLESSGGQGRGNKYNRKYGRSPIPLTLSKNRMVKALQERWEGFRSIREKYHNKPTAELDDCPICLERMQDCSWSWRDSKWSRDYNLNTVKTICNHHFCDNCWGNIKQNDDGLTKSCPLCRKHIKQTDIDRTLL